MAVIFLAGFVLTDAILVSFKPIVIFFILIDRLLTNGSFNTSIFRERDS